jgi:hypothetical protein
MADFAIRVELRGNPTREQYETLHALMARKGFLQTIAGVDNQGNQKRFNLPHAVYYGASNATCGDVRTAVANAVKAEVQNDVIVFVVQAATWALG